MAEIRTMKLNLLADTHSFAKGLKNANKSVDGFAGKLGKATRGAALGFAGLAASAGVAAIAVGTDMVMAAIEDEKAQRKLAFQLKKSTKASDAQVKSVEAYISATAMATGVADDELRPAMARLVRSTKDAKVAQDLMNVALDVSAATQKPLETVVNALGKGYDGNNASLGRLGLGIDSARLKSKDFNGVVKDLKSTFGGFAANEANTLEGRMKILRVRIDEAKESLGVALMPTFERFVQFASTTLVPAIEGIANGFSGNKSSLSNKVKALNNELGYGNETSAYNLGESLRDIADAMTQLFDSLNNGSESGSILTDFANGIKKVASAFDAVRNAWDKIPGPLQSFLFSKNKMLGSIGLVKDTASYLNGKRALGGPVTGGGSYLVGERGPEIFTPRSSGAITANGSMGGNTFVFNGVVDGESARRSIERLFQTSSRISGAPNFTGAIS